MKRLMLALTVVVSVLLGGRFSMLGQSGPPAAQPAQGPPTFRSGVNIVPVDVRVIDRDGKPVADLRQ
jgi:hypothetical protein